MDTSRTSLREARRSESPRSPSPGRDTRRREAIQRMTDISAEAERWSRMTPDEKIEENASDLRHLIESEPALAVLLQPAPPRYMARAQCQADHCFFAEGETVIRDEYRIVLNTQPREYFHVVCIERLLNLPSLASTRFRLDTDSYRWNQNQPWTWSLMLRKWFEHGGRINLQKIANYTKALKQYRNEEADFGTAWIDWHWEHRRKCNDGEELCSCPSQPTAPEKPFLGDYRTQESDVCPLSEVLRDQYVGRLASA
jgi:hypothetical protein